ncbi:MAG: hypothetical protein BWY80_00604 [Firmicutes bacterium ADurb.Bin456]|nr:MAG: hypothetical protein BWY80_00604 [Firmicutes bacterium ADurb.Bin456]
MGNGAPALPDFPRGQIGPGCPENSPHAKPMVLVKSGILDCQKGVYNMFGNFFDVHGNTVLDAHVGYQVPVFIVNHGCGAGFQGCRAKRRDIPDAGQNQSNSGPAPYQHSQTEKEEKEAAGF